MLNFFLSVPYVIRVIVSLFLILAFNKMIKRLWLSVLFGTLILALWLGHSFESMLNISWMCFSSANNLFLMMVVFQVIWLSSQMSLTGSMKDLVERVRSLLPQRVSMALLPAIIGLLPMPGGAIFSAPLIDDCDPDKKVPSLLKTKINYWFRHVWEYWWPLYPGVLLGVEITGLPILTFMILQLPMSLLSILAGYFLLLRKIDHSKKEKKEKYKYNIIQLLSPLVPIIVIIFSYAGIRLLFPQVAQINKYLPMIIGIFLSQIILQIKQPLSFIYWKKILFSNKTFIMAVIVLIIRIYGAFIEAELPDGSLLMTQMRNELNSWGFPLIIVMMAIPYISGLTTGVAIGFVGASFPIVMSLIGEDPSFRTLLSTTVLAYGFGYMGMILSPVHICLIVSNEHFKTSLSSSIFRLIKPALVILSGSLLYYFILR